MPIYYKTARENLKTELCRICTKLLEPGKGVLATEECLKRLMLENGIPNNATNRCRYRELLFNRDIKMGQHISGIVFSDEALQQYDANCERFFDILRQQGILMGITLDKGIVPLGSADSEFSTQGLDDLAVRCKEYKKQGIAFAEWRCQFEIGQNTPSYCALIANANILARYASICQSAGMVPIVVTQVQQVGTHTLDHCQVVTESVLSFLLKALSDHHVYLEGIILKTSMVLPGIMNNTEFSDDDIALATVEALRRTVPAAVAGIMFFSGDQSKEDATMRLNQIQKVALVKPWPLTFSYGYAILQPVVYCWNGKYENADEAKEILMHAILASSDACKGNYEPVQYDEESM